MIRPALFDIGGKMNRVILTVTIAMVICGYAVSSSSSDRAADTVKYQELDLTGIGEKAYYGNV